MKQPKYAYTVKDLSKENKLGIKHGPNLPTLLCNYFLAKGHTLENSLIMAHNMAQPILQCGAMEYTYKSIFYSILVKVN